MTASQADLRCTRRHKRLCGHDSRLDDRTGDARDLERIRLKSLDACCSAMRERLHEAVTVQQLMLADATLIEAVVNTAEAVAAALAAGNRIFFAGNGVSAADAQHLTTEFISKFAFDRPGLPAMSLASDASTITAIANDYGYDKLFRRQLEAQSRPGDVFIGMTTSGRSPNILAALDVCARLRVTSVVFCATSGTLPVVDHTVRVPSRSAPRIQEAHVLLGHLICAHVELRLFEHLQPT